MVRFILAAGLAVGAYYSVKYCTEFKQSNVGCSVVEATVMSQIDKTYYTYEEDEDGIKETKTEKKLTHKKSLKI